MTRSDLKRLAALLKAEHSALARGDLARLEKLAPRKLSLLDRLESGALPDTALDKSLARQVQVAAQRNARLFEAAIAGIRDARRLITSARERGRGQTYGRNGARAALDPPAGSLHKRY